jgi:hypothetical protein
MNSSTLPGGFTDRADWFWSDQIIFQVFEYSAFFIESRVFRSAKLA